MKKFLFTLAALCLAGNALADSGFFFGTLDESTIGVTNESSMVLTQDDLAVEEYELYMGAYWSARISGTECRITWPEGMTPVFAEGGADMTIESLNARGRTATETAAIAGLVDPYDAFVTTFNVYGYYKDETGAIVNYGVNKWEAGLYEEMMIFYIAFDENFQGGDIEVTTYVASGRDVRGGTVIENGEHAHSFTFTCHVSVEGAEQPVVPTDKPVITSEDTGEAVVVTATGNGHICLYWDDQLVAEGEGEASYTIAYGEDPEGEEYGFSATAQEEGKEVSEYAVATIFVPGKQPVVIPDLPGYIIIGAPAANGEFYVNYLPGDYEGDYEMIVTINGETVEANENGTYQAVEGENNVVVTIKADGYNDKVATNDFNFHYATTAPAPTFVWNEETYTMEAVCDGHTVVLLANGTEVENPYTVEQTDVEQSIEFSAYTVAADEDNNSAVVYYAANPVIIPAKPVVVTPPAAPTYEVTYDEDNMYITFTCEEGELTIYDENGQEVAENPIVIARPEYDEAADPVYVHYSAKATKDGVDSETVYVNEKVNQKDKPMQTIKPLISVFDDPEAQTVTVTATGDGHICLYWDDQLVAEGEGTATYVIAYGEDPEGEEYGFSATAQEDGKLVSDYALETVFVPGKTVEPYQTPDPEISTELTEDALVITVTGEGTVTLYVQYINNETGEMTTETYTGEGTVTVPVARGEQDAYINYWATAQADEEAYPAITEAEYYVEVPAKEQVTPVDPHMTGWWIVLIDANGEEVWYELHEGTDGSWVTTVTLNYGDYGTFYWDPDLSAAENNVNRPNVPYYFVVNGQVWDADEANKATLMGEAANTMSNPLFENDAEINYYTVPVGYSYVLGIYVDPSTDDQLQDGTWYYVYCAQGPQTDVDELNAAKTVAGVRYFNLAGQEMQEANGMTIVVTTYTDGTTSAVKVMK